MSAQYEVGDGYASALNQTAIDLIPGNLAAQAHQWVQTYYYNAADHSDPYPETLDIYTGFSNASAANYIDVQAMVSHGGMRDSGIIIDASSAIDVSIYFRLPYTRFHGFGITGTFSYAGTTNIIYSYAWAVRFYENILFDLLHTGDRQIMILTLNGAGQVGGMHFFNNICVNADCTPSAYKAWMFYIPGAPIVGHPWEIHNNVFINGGGRGFYSVNREYLNISNNYMGGGAAFYGLGGANCNINYNISSDGTADDFGGVGNLAFKAAADQFVDVTPGSEDLHLLAHADCRRRGQDNSSLFGTDCRGRLRRRWSTGAIEPYPWYQNGMIPPEDNFRDNVIDNLKASLSSY